MSTNCERPVSRYQPPDWHERNYKLANTARATREQSHNLRKEAQLLKVKCSRTSVASKSYLYS